MLFVPMLSYRRQCIKTNSRIPVRCHVSERVFESWLFSHASNYCRFFGKKCVPYLKSSEADGMKGDLEQHNVRSVVLEFIDSFWEILGNGFKGGDRWNVLSSNEHTGRCRTYLIIRSSWYSALIFHRILLDRHVISNTQQLSWLLWTIRVRP